MPGARQSRNGHIMNALNGSQARTLRRRWRKPTLRLDGDMLGREAGHRIWEFRETARLLRMERVGRATQKVKGRG
jgi:hypothetical protein